MHGTVGGRTTRLVAGDARGLNLYLEDRSLGDLLALRLPRSLLEHVEPHFVALGEEVGGSLDDLARLADRHPPELHHRDRYGADRQRIEYHPAYRALEAAGFGRYGLAAASHREGVLGWPEPLPAVVKYAMTYLFAQAEFGLLCPISMTDALTRVLRRFAGRDLLDRYLPGLLSLDPDEALQGAMFITEKAGGSDVGATETVARRVDGGWRLFGDKWFCSNADADLALVLARPEGAPAGTRGLGLFLMPRVLDDGRPNAYRIVRLKDKLGTRSMASGEAVLEGAVAYPVGDLDRGFAQMAEMINASRLSNGVRAAGLMRRAWHEALAVCRSREVFGQRLIELPLQRRQLMKILLPVEQALSMVLYTADVLDRADAGEEQAASALRLLTPLIKFRACRDARKVTGDAMEIRAGCGFIEDFVEPRLLRDAHLGSIWEGTSNIVAIDAVRRAVGRKAADAALLAEMRALLAQCHGLPPRLLERLEEALARAAALARTSGSAADDGDARRAASALYHASSAVLMAWEGVRNAEAGGDLRRAMLAVLVLDHRLSPRDPLAPSDASAEAACAGVFLDGTPADASAVERLVETLV
jgi:acyl-CoA dehydrogenase